VISVNGNVVALSAEECVNLSKKIPAKIEINLFHRTEKRIKKLADELKKFNPDKIYGIKGDSRIKDLDHDRSFCDKDGIFTSDVVLVPLEDGDRCKALKDMGKKVITIDLNPLSRTAKTADITIIDNIVRAIPNISRWANLLKKEDKKEIEKIILDWNNKKMLKEVCSFISKRLNSLF
jgi:4-phosphopantoate--beta-alanine ligase